MCHGRLEAALGAEPLHRLVVTQLAAGGVEREPLHKVVSSRGGQLVHVRREGEVAASRLREGDLRCELCHLLFEAPVFTLELVLPPLEFVQLLLHLGGHPALGHERAQVLDLCLRLLQQRLGVDDVSDARLHLDALGPVREAQGAERLHLVQGAAADGAEHLGEAIPGEAIAEQHGERGVAVRHMYRDPAAVLLRYLRGRRKGLNTRPQGAERLVDGGELTCVHLRHARPEGVPPLVPGEVDEVDL
mmetsp:Transcript_69656/g.182626  ORF Transcript_69656/g.182626 Transcript_69656/m.182626 type:complete len:246 (-) Transcript_69656:196-933(-)